MTNKHDSFLSNILSQLNEPNLGHTCCSRPPAGRIWVTAFTAMRLIIAATAQRWRVWALVAKLAFPGSIGDNLVTSRRDQSVRRHSLTVPAPVHQS